MSTIFTTSTVSTVSSISDTSRFSSPPEIIFSPLALASERKGIQSVDVPLYANRLRDDFPSAADVQQITKYLRDKAFALPFDAFLDVGSRLYALRQAFLQNSCLLPLLSGMPPLSFSRRGTTEIIHDVKGSLIITMYQLGMLEFLQDIDRYIRELAEAHSPPSSEYESTVSICSISASSSPLNSDEEKVFLQIESMWTGGHGMVPLPTYHPHYNDSCHHCHHLGHFRPTCPFYQCPHCMEWKPGHPQSNCPKRCRTTLAPSPSTSASSSNRSAGSSRQAARQVPSPRRRGPYQRPYGADRYEEDSEIDCDFTFDHGAEDYMTGDRCYGERDWY
jgi:hypothetical protein